MEFGPHMFQIFATLLVVLSAVFVALVCDLLKGNNERLREQNVELRVRREEEHRRYELMLANAHAEAAAEKVEAPKTEQAPAAAATEERVQKSPRVAEKRRIAQDALAVMERGAQMAARRGPIEMPVPEILPEPRIAAELEIEHVAARPAGMAMERSAEPVELVLGSAPAESLRPAANASGRDWSSLLTKRATGPDGSVEVSQTAGAARTDLLAAVVAATDSTTNGDAAASALPAGLQDGFVLTKLVENQQPVSGLVVSIGVTAEDAEATSKTDLADAVRMLVESLLGPEDFAAPSAEGEYLMICPSARGAAAQRRLSEIAQQLWDFQLRSMGKYSVLFSWGGVEVRSESITEAIASATERMQETRRGRKLLSMDSASLPKAV